MAPRRPLPLIRSPPPRPEDDPESEEVSEEGNEKEEEEGQDVAEEEVGDDGSQEEAEVQTENNQSLPSKKKATMSDSGSDSESDTDSGRARAKPVEPKYSAGSKKLKPSKLAGSKRPAEAEPKENKKKKKKKKKKRISDEEKMKKHVSKRGVDEEDKKKKRKKKKKKKKKSAEGDEKKEEEISVMRIDEDEKNEETSKSRMGEEGKKTEVPKAVMGEDERKSPFQRIWRDEDEINALNGLIHLQSKTCDDKVYDFIKESLSVRMSKSQVSDKIRRMKKKFLVNAESKDPVFSKPHDNKIFELSSKIWSADGSAKGKKPLLRGATREPPTSEGKKKVETYLKEANVGVEEDNIPNRDADAVEGDAVDPKDAVEGDDVDPEEFWSRYPLLRESLGLIPEACHNTLAVKAMKILGRETAEELEDSWRNHYLMRLQLISRQNGLMLGALESSTD